MGLEWRWVANQAAVVCSWRSGQIQRLSAKCLDKAIARCWFYRPAVKSIDSSQYLPAANEIPRENREAVMALAHGVTIMTSDPLVRSSSDRMLAGVCGGLAQWLEWDPTALRIVVALTAFFTGVVPGLVIYVMFAIIMPADRASLS
jgi:phage shock protein C